jgi:hypothetical protein
VPSEIYGRGHTGNSASHRRMQMSLPSIVAILKEWNIADVATVSCEVREEILAEAMRRDLPLAVDLLHAKSHEAKLRGGCAHWIEDPNSPIGKQLIRLHASDAMRPLASKHFAHGARLTFVNCCKGVVEFPPKPEDERPNNDIDVYLLQIQTQNGDVAYADC